MFSLLINKMNAQKARLKMAKAIKQKDISDLTQIYALIKRYIVYGYIIVPFQISEKVTNQLSENGYLVTENWDLCHYNTYISWKDSTIIKN